MQRGEVGRRVRGDQGPRFDDAAAVHAGASGDAWLPAAVHTGGQPSVVQAGRSEGVLGRFVPRLPGAWRRHCCRIGGYLCQNVRQRRVRYGNRMRLTLICRREESDVLRRIAPRDAVGSVDQRRRGNENRGDKEAGYTLHLGLHHL